MNSIDIIAPLTYNAPGMGMGGGVVVVGGGGGDEKSKAMVVQCH